ncbi:MAG: CHAT domain-containing protein [Verrucomicrobia bacterium]|nr:CHAT domain-containing protein [Verrucomicrobiota bacterium]
MNTLLLHYALESPGADGWVNLIPMIRRNDGRLVFSRTYPRLCVKSKLEDTSGRFVRTVSAAIHAMGSSVDLQSAAVFYGELQRLGSDLGQQLLPAEMAGLLLDDEVRHVTFCCDPRLNGVPFEGIWLGGDFLSHRFGTGRELLSTAPTACGGASRGSPLPFSAKLFLALPEDLDEAERTAVESQAADFERQWRARETPAAIQFDPVQSDELILPEDVLEAFRTRDLVGIYGHHDYDANAPASSGYRLSGGRTFTAQQLLEGFGPGQVAPRLVFSLCCESAITRGWEETWPASKQLYGMVDAAKRIGVEHYIGTLVRIPALRTVGVFHSFFHALANGYSVGEALRRARMSFRQNGTNPSDGGTILGLALTLYGDPSAALVSRSGHSTAEVHAPACEGRTQDGFCGKAVAPQDPGYALRLCPDHYSPECCGAGHVLAPGSSVKRCARCQNAVCLKCSGWGRESPLCVEHCCYDGHEIVAGIRKLCSDPQARHPGEKRSICPLDEGWLRGLCRDCLRC